MNDKISNIIKTKNYICAILGTILLIFGVGLTIYDIVLEQKAINMNARVVSIDYKGNDRYAAVEYKVNGTKYNQAVPIGTNENISVNDEIKIKYDKDNPSLPINNNHTLTSIVSIAFSIIFLLLGLKGTIKELKKQSKISHLEKKGIYIECPISEVYINNLVKPFQGKYPYRLRCRYLNPKDNKEYVFESFDTYINLQEIINKYGNKTILVFIDKQDSFNYYVDLSSLFPQLKLTSPAELMNQSEEQKEESVENKENSEENAENKEGSEENKDEKNESNPSKEEKTS